MKLIELDAAGWSDPEDFYAALLPRLGAPSWHGHNLNALNDSIFGGGINDVEPPYRIVICNMAGLDADMSAFVAEVMSVFDEGYADVEAHLVLKP